eukprot:702025-Amphidinium_carterae.1
MPYSQFLEFYITEVEDGANACAGDMILHSAYSLTYQPQGQVLGRATRLLEHIARTGVVRIVLRPSGKCSSGWRERAPGKLLIRTPPGFWEQLGQEAEQMWKAESQTTESVRILAKPARQPQLNVWE